MTWFYETGTGDKMPNLYGPGYDRMTREELIRACENKQAALNHVNAELDKANARIDYLMSPDSSSPEDMASEPSAWMNADGLVSSFPGGGYDIPLYKRSKPQVQK